MLSKNCRDTAKILRRVNKPILLVHYAAALKLKLQQPQPWLPVGVRGDLWKQQEGAQPFSVRRVAPSELGRQRVRASFLKNSISPSLLLLFFSFFPSWLPLRRDDCAALKGDLGGRRWTTSAHSSSLTSPPPPLQLNAGRWVAADAFILELTDWFHRFFYSSFLSPCKITLLRRNRQCCVWFIRQQCSRCLREGGW